MPRIAAFPNRVADALVTALKTINAGTGPDTWLTTPRSVTRTLNVSSLTIDERPCLVVAIDAIRGRGRGARLHFSEVDLAVYCFAETERASLNLASDVMLAVAQNELLGGILKMPLQNIEVKVDTEIAGAEQSALVVSITAVGQWDHSSTTDLP